MWRSGDSLVTELTGVVVCRLTLSPPYSRTLRRRPRVNLYGQIAPEVYENPTLVPLTPDVCTPLAAARHVFKVNAPIQYPRQEENQYHPETCNPELSNLQ